MRQEEETKARLIYRFVGDITWGGVECSGAGAMRVEKRWNKRVENGKKIEEWKPDRGRY